MLFSEHLQLLLISLCLSLSAAAQDGKKLQEPAPDPYDPLADQCRLCDSMADAYLAVGDTSMAIHYFQMYADSHQNEYDRKNAATKLRRLFYSRRQSFYLEDH